MPPYPMAHQGRSRGRGGRGGRGGGGRGGGGRSFHRPKPCRYHYSPGGCRRGAACHFSHAAVDGPAARARTGSSAGSTLHDHNGAGGGNCHGDQDGPSPTTVVDATAPAPAAAGAAPAGPPPPPPPPSSWINNPAPAPTAAVGSRGQAERDVDELLLESLGLTSADLHLAVHGTAAAASCSGSGGADPTGMGGINTGTWTSCDDATRIASGSDDDRDRGHRTLFERVRAVDDSAAEVQQAACAMSSLEVGDDNADEEDDEEDEVLSVTEDGAADAGGAGASIGASRSLLSPVRWAEAERSLSRLEALLSSRSSCSSVDADRSQSQSQSWREDFSAALQMCRSVQLAAVDVLERAMLSMSMSSAAVEAELSELLGLNERLLAAIGSAERSLVVVDDDDAEAGQASREERSIDGEVRGGKEEEKVKDAPKTATEKKKKKRIRKKKNKSTEEAEDDSDAKATSAAVAHTPAELAEIRAEEVEATRRAEAAAAEAAEQARQDERERMARMREEARRQQAAARERKQAKKAQKHQRRVAEQEEAKAARTQFWEEERTRSRGRVEILESLCIAELLRQSRGRVMGLSASRVREDGRAMATIREVSHKACLELYKHDSTRRVVVAGVNATAGSSGGRHGNSKKELNGRHGTIISYDEAKGEYTVALDTKKGKQDDVQVFKPENLDVAPENGGANSKRNKSIGHVKKDGPGAKVHSVDFSYGINLQGLLSYGGVSLDLEYFLVSQSDVAGVERAFTLEDGLKAFADRRDKEERIQKRLEAEERAREVEERRRRAELRAREEEERRRRQADKEREREEMREFLRKQRERKAAGKGSDDGRHHRRYYEESDNEYYDDDDDDEYEEFCDCAECRMRARMRDFMFMSSMFGGGRRGGGMGGIPAPIFMAMFGGRMGGMPFGPGGMGGGFYYEEDDDEDEYDEEDDDEEDFFSRFFSGGGFDGAWEEREARRRQEKNEEQAEILGVPVDADAKTIKTKYRRLAIQYHPDKWRHDSDHGMTKEDAEEEFKKIQSAYDHLMANFDDDGE